MLRRFPCKCCVARPGAAAGPFPQARQPLACTPAQREETGMRDWTAGVLLALGALCVVAGLVVIVIKGLATPVGGEAEATVGAGSTNRFVRTLLTLSSVDRLILWGVLL